MADNIPTVKGDAILFEPLDLAPLLPWFLLGAACVLICVAYWMGWTQGIVDATPAICESGKP